MQGSFISCLIIYILTFVETEKEVLPVLLPSFLFFS